MKKIYDVLLDKNMPYGNFCERNFQGLNHLSISEVNYMNGEIEEIVDAGKVLRTRWIEFSALWRSSGLPLNRKHGEFEGENFEGYSRLILETLDSFCRAAGLERRAKILIIPRADDIKKHISTAQIWLDDLLTEFHLHQDGKFQEVGGNVNSLQGCANSKHLVIINTGVRLRKFTASVFGARHAGAWW